MQTLCILTGGGNGNSLCIASNCDTSGLNLSWLGEKHHYTAEDKTKKTEVVSSDLKTSLYFSLFVWRLSLVPRLRGRKQPHTGCLSPPTQPGYKASGGYLGSRFIVRQSEVLAP